MAAVVSKWTGVPVEKAWGDVDRVGPIERTGCDPGKVWILT